MTELSRTQNKLSPFFEAGLDQTRSCAAGILTWNASDPTKTYRESFGWQRKVAQIELLPAPHGSALLRILNTHALNTGILTLDDVTSLLIRYCKDNNLHFPQPTLD